MDKIQLHELFVAALKGKIEDGEAALERLKESSWTATKSSAGDKFETSREMLRQEIDKSERYLVGLVEQMNELIVINPEVVLTEVGIGAYVVTNMGHLFITSPMGSIKHDGKKYYAISTESPMSLALWGKKEGEKAKVNDREVVIKSIM